MALHVFSPYILEIRLWGSEFIVCKFNVKVACPSRNPSPSPKLESYNELNVIFEAEAKCTKCKQCRSECHDEFGRAVKKHVKEHRFKFVQCSFFKDTREMINNYRVWAQQSHFGKGFTGITGIGKRSNTCGANMCQPLFTLTLLAITWRWVETCWNMLKLIILVNMSRINRMDCLGIFRIFSDVHLPSSTIQA